MARKGFFAIFAFLAAAVAAFSQKSSTSSDTGVLLGLRSNDHYHTLWITFRNLRSDVEQVNGLLVPRSDGFSWIGHYYTSTEFDSAPPSDYGSKDASIEEHLWIRPSEDRSTVSIMPPSKRVTKPDDFDNYCDQDSIVVDYAGPKYISVKDASSAPCGQNPAVTVIYSHGSTDELTRDVPKPHWFTNTELLGTDREVALEKDRDAGMIPDCPANDFPDQPMWTVNHRRGRWAMEGWQSVVMQCGGGRDYKIHVSPEPFVGRNELFPPWKEIASKIPDAIDAVSSPRKDHVVVMTATGILIFRVDGKKEWQALGKFPLWVYTDDPNETEHAIVMSEWALGRHVESWDQEIMRQQKLRSSDQP